MTLILTIMIFLSCIAMLAIGIIFSRKPLKEVDAAKYRTQRILKQAA